MRALILVWGLLLWSLTLAGQSYHVAGLVLDELNQPMPGCYVRSNGSAAVTDVNGRFIFNHLSKEELHLEVSFLGYLPFDTLLRADGHHHLRINLKPDAVQLAEVEVEGRRLQTASNQSRTLVQTLELDRQHSGTLVRTLDRQVGFNSMDIGASASKPVIRGMSFNRVVVVSNGVKQEGQQWGADHGLEMDPFLSEQAEIIKGAASLEYGSDALGGILQLTSNRIPAKGLSGKLQLLGKTVNETGGISALLQGSDGRWFFKGRATALDYGDYRVPTDTVVYLTRQLPIHKERLKNTAGREMDGYLQLGRTGDHWRSSVSLSRVDQKSGFFPGAHGVPDAQRVADDGNTRNIDFPHQEVRHWNVTSNTLVQTPHSALSLDAGYQRNHRQEWSEFHTHYGTQEAPDEQANLELDFLLETWSANAGWNFRLTPKYAFTLGGQYQYQQNQSAGYSFLLPEFERQSRGLFLKHDYKLGEHWVLNGGLRYDWVDLQTEGYYDPLLFAYLVERGQTNETAAAYAQRAANSKRNFGALSWAGGLSYRPVEGLKLALNLGESFRAPTPNELTTNGVHHGAFRHEQGWGDLSPERGFYTDVLVEYQQEERRLSLSPYLYHFSNYIFLNPSGTWSLLPHAGQVYRYTESEAVLTGLELQYSDRYGEHWQVELNGEWIYNYQRGDNAYPLPFSPPANLFGELSYLHTFSPNREPIRWSLNTKAVAAQNRVARNEATTPGYLLLGAAIGLPLRAGRLPMELNIQVQNLLNTRYYNHLSFYRRLEIPEPGRNVQVLLNIPF